MPSQFLFCSDLPVRLCLSHHLRGNLTLQLLLKEGMCYDSDKAGSAQATETKETSGTTLS
ncbi:hypothetical protein RJ45_18110 [Photobacterium gaetbulicola]|uniref:Uncharacterized protein n=1 Tax=Photobacterium gaetbulicola TaxID=1295392 RepID=A0A0B9GU40_9GAMM|nr:hypothetical protein RJ45_18110 [Photobacterium gaetbulicola]